MPGEYTMGGVAMKKILIPIDGTERSTKSIDLVKTLYKPEDVSIILLMVREDVATLISKSEIDAAREAMRDRLEELAAELDGYDVSEQVVFGRAGDEILVTAKEENVDIIVMTKSTKKGWIQTIGSVTAYVVKYANCIVMIAPEATEAEVSKGKKH